MISISIIIALIAFYNVEAQTTTVPAVAPCPSNVNNPCKNFGFCVILFGTQLSCTCNVGWTGTFCEISQQITTTISRITTTTTVPAVLECPSSVTICKNNGQCLISNGVNYYCRCPSGFSGIYCENSSTFSTSTVVDAFNFGSNTSSCPPSFDICQNGAQCLGIFNFISKIKKKNKLTNIFFNLSNGWNGFRL